jgi:hypothetical protein
VGDNNWRGGDGSGVVEVGPLELAGQSTGEERPAEAAPELWKGPWEVGRAL